jgi:NADH dehydrogenase
MSEFTLSLPASGGQAEGHPRRIGYIMILVTGGAGFVGSHLVPRLTQSEDAVRPGAPSRSGAERRVQVRLLARRGGPLPGAEVIPGDVRDLSAVVAAARGCRAVIHLVGIIRERQGARFEAVHVGGTRNIIRACQEAGIRRLLHMSALGARPRARSRYHRSKWEAEELVRASGLAATIFRPSVMFGSGNGFLPELRSLLHRGPFIPIIGSGTNLLQPIWVEDVVSCFLGALQQPETVGRAFALGGPAAYGFEQLVDLLADAEGVRKPKLHLPPVLLRPAVALLGRFSRFPLTSDQLTMLLEDNVCDITEMCHTFGFSPAPLTDHLAD